MNVRKISVRPNKYGFDPNLMVACISKVAEYNPGFSIDDIARGAVALYGRMADLVAANGGEVEVPRMQHCHISKEGAC